MNTTTSTIVASTSHVQTKSTKKQPSNDVGSTRSTPDRKRKQRMMPTATAKRTRTTTEEEQCSPSRVELPDKNVSKRTIRISTASDGRDSSAPTQSLVHGEDIEAGTQSASGDDQSVQDAPPREHSAAPAIALPTGDDPHPDQRTPSQTFELTKDEKEQACKIIRMLNGIKSEQEKVSKDKVDLEKRRLELKSFQANLDTAEALIEKHMKESNRLKEMKAKAVEELKRLDVGIEMHNRKHQDSCNSLSEARKMQMQFEEELKVREQSLNVAEIELHEKNDMLRSINKFM